MEQNNRVDEIHYEVLASPAIQQRKEHTMGKVTGKLVGSAHGITVTVSHHPAKTTKGKNRLWLQIRQNNGKPWRVYQSLAYTHGVDIAFVSEP